MDSKGVSPLEHLTRGLLVTDTRRSDRCVQSYLVVWHTEIRQAKNCIEERAAYLH